MNLSQKIELVERLLHCPWWHRLFFWEKSALPQMVQVQDSFSFSIEQRPVIRCRKCKGYYESGIYNCDAARYPGDSCIERLQQPCRIPAVEGCFHSRKP